MSDKKQQLGDMPVWDLSDFYPTHDAPAVAADIKKATELCTAFADHYASALPNSAAGFGQAIGEYEVIDELFAKLGSYAQLLYAKFMDEPKVVQFYQNTTETLTQLASSILFFTLEINKLDDAAIKELLEEPSVAHYASWLRDIRSFKPYQLSDDLEKILLEKHVAGAAAWTRLFDETITAMRFEVDGNMLTEPEVMEMMSDKDAAVRKKGALSIGAAFNEKAPLFALITNTLAKDKFVEDKWRGFDAPISSRNVSNYIEDEVVEALLSAVQEKFADLSHRYYAIKAKWFEQDKLAYWDRNAPLPFADDKVYNWQESKTLVLDSFSSFSPRLAEVGATFFDSGWIDAPVKEGKSPGAFAHPTVPSVHPYLLLNHQGKSRDVMTLAHELGHGVHQVLAAKQGQLMCDTPLTLAETASVFGEQLTFQQMVASAADDTAKKALIAGKVEDMLNTVVRQVAFCLFEKEVHARRKEGELSVEELGDIWMKVQAQSLGPAIDLKAEGHYDAFWMYIPHFIHSPFYVYAYAFGDCLVNSLYAVYEQEKAAGNAADFEQKYITMLEAGGTLRHKELLAPFGLDATNPDFWKQGLGVIERFIDELE